MKLRFSLTILLLSVLARNSGAVWRDSVDSLWPDKPVVIDGRATEWSDYPVQEVGGLSFRAKNDKSNLYLLIRGANDAGRILLSGNYRQTITVWFLKPDAKTKAWGIMLDFGSVQEPESEVEDLHTRQKDMTSLSDMGMMPEMVLQQGLEVSTTTFPSDFAFQADLSSKYGRQPIYEIQIPLSMIERKGKEIFFDVISSAVSQQIQSEMQGRAPASSGSEQKGGPSGSGGGGGGGGHGGHHGRGMGGSGGGGAKSMEVPAPLNLHLKVALTKEPRH